MPVKGFRSPGKGTTFRALFGTRRLAAAIQASTHRPTSRRALSVARPAGRPRAVARPAPGRRRPRPVRRGQHPPVHRPLPQGGDRRTRRGADPRRARRARVPAPSSRSGARRSSRRSRSRASSTPELAARIERRDDQAGARGPLPAVQAEAPHPRDDRARARPRAARRRCCGRRTRRRRRRSRPRRRAFVDAEKEVPDVADGARGRARHPAPSASPRTPTLRGCGARR